MRHRIEVGRVKIHKVRGIYSPIKYSALPLFFYLSSVMVKAERKVLLELTNFLPTQCYLVIELFPLYSLSNVLAKLFPLVTCIH